MPDVIKSAENQPNGGTMDGTAEDDGDESDDEDPRLLNVRSVFQKGVAISTRIRWLVSGSFMGNLKAWHSTVSKHSAIPVYACLLRAKPAEEIDVEATDGNRYSVRVTFIFTFHLHDVYNTVSTHSQRCEM